MTQLNIEFMPWYQAGRAIMRCGGDDGCGSLLVSGDTEQHLKWHQRMFPYDAPQPKPSWKRPASPELTGEVCTDPDCTIPRKPGRPMHGPHTLRAKGE